MVHTEFVVAGIAIPVVVGSTLVLFVLLPYWENLPDRSSFIGMDISVLPERGAYVYLECYFVSASGTLWYGNELPDSAWVQWNGSPPHPHVYYVPPKQHEIMILSLDQMEPLPGRIVFEADEEMRGLSGIIRWDKQEFCHVHSASDGITTYRIHP
ncbi:MAG: hypothetical protein F4010_00560 [Cenarchaeum sp. SB0669_bin_11]|nr:hypothetical protein [Cenarchaeum sp. SB0669_bin_11]